MDTPFRFPEKTNAKQTRAHCLGKSGALIFAHQQIKPHKRHDMKDCLPCKAKRKNARPWMVGGIAFLGMSFLGGASAQESPWTLRAGPAGVFWDQSSKVTVAGSGVPGAEINLNNNYTLGL